MKFNTWFTSFVAYWRIQLLTIFILHSFIYRQSDRACSWQLVTSSPPARLKSPKTKYGARSLLVLWQHCLENGSALGFLTSQSYIYAGVIRRIKSRLDRLPHWAVRAKYWPPDVVAERHLNTPYMTIYPGVVPYCLFNGILREKSKNQADGSNPNKNPAFSLQDGRARRIPNLDLQAQQAVCMQWQIQSWYAQRSGE